MPEVTKTIMDANGASFQMRMWDDGTGKLAPIHYQGAGQITFTLVSVTTTAQTLSALLTAAGGSVLTDRRMVGLQVKSTGVLYVGDSGVTATNSISVDSSVGNASIGLALDASHDAYLAGSAAIDVMVAQFA